MQNVSIFRRGKSPYWYLAYFDPVLNKRIPGRSTKIRVDDPLGRRKVLEMAREKSETAKALRPVVGASAWELWAEKYLCDRYPEGLTRTRAMNAWKVLREWLHVARLPAPAMLRYEHAQHWIDWRTTQDRPNGKKISHNTAHTDLTFLQILMREALRRGFISANPLERHGIHRVAPKEKPEITDEQDQLVLAKLVELKKPQWMHDSYLVGMAQGCRLSECATPMQDIDERRRVITFDAKGSNRFATLLHEDLLGLVARRRAEKAAVLVELPFLAARDWCYFFDEIGLPEHSFHCTRVTVITKMARAGVPVQQAMAYVGHASETIHRIYQRLLPQDLSQVAGALSRRPSGATSENSGAPAPTPRTRKAARSAP